MEIGPQCLQVYQGEIEREKNHCTDQSTGRERSERRKRRAKRENWYKKGGYESVIFVPSTPHSQLAKRYHETVKETGLKIKVVERSGRTVKSILQKSDPHEQPRCTTEEGCMVCEGVKGNGRREN